MVESGGLENRCALPGTVGSNPTLSATKANEAKNLRAEASERPIHHGARRGSTRGARAAPFPKTERCESG